MAVGSGGDRRDRRLKSWKEIAAFFGTDERTVRRWQDRGLPVHRLPGGARATVYAEVSELETWLRSEQSAEAAPVPPEPPAGEPPSRRALLAWAGGGLAALGVAALVISWSGAPPPETHQPSQRALELYLAGTYDLERRTPASLQRARELFGRAIAEDPGYADPYSGLAFTYLLLREYSSMPESEAYPRAKHAAERALELNPDLADAHSALAFVTFYWSKNWQSGLRGFERAIELDPTSARANHWYATALLHAARVEDSLRAIERAQRLEPSSRSIRADRAFILYHSGRAREAVAELRQMAALEPEFYSPHFYLTIIYLAEGRHEDYLAEAGSAARLRGDMDQLALVRQAERGYRVGGGAGMLRAMVAEELRQRRAGRSSDYALGAAYARAGDSANAMRLLRNSWRAGESPIVGLRMDPRFRGLAREPEFRELVARVGRPG
jgi:tetratricopeptide (TPR) repeat protein